MSASDSPSVSSPAVLVVDDEPLVRAVVLDILSEISVTTYEAGDAEEALFVLAAYPNIAVLLTDISMPGAIDGMGLAMRVHQLRPDVGIIVTSGKPRALNLAMPVQATFLAKPYQPRQLLEVIDGMLASFP